MEKSVGNCPSVAEPPVELRNQVCRLDFKSWWLPFAWNIGEPDVVWSERNGYKFFFTVNIYLFEVCKEVTFTFFSCPYKSLNYTVKLLWNVAGCTVDVLHVFGSRVFWTENSSVILHVVCVTFRTGNCSIKV